MPSVLILEEEEDGGGGEVEEERLDKRVYIDVRCNGCEFKRTRMQADAKKETDAKNTDAKNTDANASKKYGCELTNLCASPPTSTLSICSPIP